MKGSDTRATPPDESLLLALDVLTDGYEAQLAAVEGRLADAEELLVRCCDAMRSAANTMADLMAALDEANHDRELLRIALRQKEDR